MAQGSQSKLRQELDAMLRQRDQYSLALDTATDPQAAIRLQRTLDRLEDEIEGLKEALQAMPAAAEAMPAAAQAPDWEDEPATAIFDPDGGMLPPGPPPLQRPPPAPAPPAPPVEQDEPLTVPIPSDFRRQSEIPTDVGQRPQHPSTEQKPSQVTTAPGTLHPLQPDYAAPGEATQSSWEPEATEVAAVPPIGEAGAAQVVDGPDPTIAVTAPVDPTAEVEPSTDPMPRPQPGTPASMPPQYPPPAGAQLRESSRALPDPLGPVVLDALEPPTGEIRKEEAVSPASPLSLPGQPTATTGDANSPFGGAAGPSFDIASEPPPEQSWSTAGKILLALVVGAFLAGAFWVLSQ